MRLFESPFFEVTVDEARSLVVFRRTHARFETLAAMDAAYDDVIAALDTLDRGNLALLLDSRDAPARNDPDFEKAFERHRRATLRGFTRVAILVKTATGRLQSQRLTATIRRDGQTFTDERAAIDFLERGGG